MGSQVHAARALSAGDLIVRMPLDVVLSHSRVCELPIGEAVAAYVRRHYRPALSPCRKAVARGAMLMALIAKRCAGRWREYVCALPDTFNDALWWPQGLVDALPPVGAGHSRNHAMIAMAACHDL